MCIQWPPPDHIAPGRRKQHAPFASKERPCQQDRSPYFLREVRGDFLPSDVKTLQPVLVVLELLYATPESFEDLDHHMHIFDLREVPQYDWLVSEKRSCQARKCRVLVPARLDAALQRETAFYDILIGGGHASIIEGDDA
jgi:hypothetical protein